MSAPSGEAPAAFRYAVVLRGQELDLPGGEITLGRSRASTVTIIDPSISRVHARMHLRDGRVTIEDLGSSNGTFVNGIRLLAKAEVVDGDRLMVGETEVVLRVIDLASEHATRKIDPRDYLCGSCGRPFPEGATACAFCGTPRDSAPGREGPGRAPAGREPFTAPAGVPAMRPVPEKRASGPLLDLPLGSSPSGDMTQLASSAVHSAKRGRAAGGAPEASGPRDLLPPVDLDPLPPPPERSGHQAPVSGQRGKSPGVLGRLLGGKRQS